MKLTLFVLFCFFSFSILSQNLVGYYIDKNNNKVNFYESEAKRDSTFYLTPNIFFWDKTGKKLRKNTNKIKEFKINNSYYTSYKYFKNFKNLKRNKSNKAFGQLLISSENYLLYYYVSNIQKTKGKPEGTLIVIKKSNKLLVEKLLLPRKSLSIKKIEINKILLKYFPKCPNVFEEHYKRFKNENITFTNYIFKGFGIDNCKIPVKS